jgi:RimJ/RimL family protein N-acetyltransferase
MKNYLNEKNFILLKATTRKENYPSIKLLEKVGFKFKEQTTEGDLNIYELYLKKR